MAQQLLYTAASQRYVFFLIFILFGRVDRLAKPIVNKDVGNLFTEVNFIIHRNRLVFLEL